MTYIYYKKELSKTVGKLKNYNQKARVRNKMITLYTVKIYFKKELFVQKLNYACS
jgi:hypothetical protein